MTIEEALDAADDDELEAAYLLADGADDHWVHHYLVLIRRYMGRPTDVSFEEVRLWLQNR